MAAEKPAMGSAGKSAWWLVHASLALFAYLLTHSESDAAGRAYAAYGGIYIAASLLWLWLAEGLVPNRWDLTGAVVCLAGISISLMGQRYQ